MERAARLFNNHKYAQEVLTGDHLACAVWSAAVGKAIAAHTVPKKLVRNTLLVEVEDAIWQKQLHTLSGQILASLRKIMGTDIIQDLEFRIATPRRPPQRAESPVARDEAEQISDPVLKKVYQLSRKKATA